MVDGQLLGFLVLIKQANLYMIYMKINARMFIATLFGVLLRMSLIRCFSLSIGIVFVATSLSSCINWVSPVNTSMADSVIAIYVDTKNQLSNAATIGYDVTPKGGISRQVFYGNAINSLDGLKIKAQAMSISSDPRTVEMLDTLIAAYQSLNQIDSMKTVKPPARQFAIEQAIDAIRQDVLAFTYSEYGRQQPTSVSK